jgi:chitin deacetylase
VANRVDYLNTSKGSLEPDQINAILGLPATKLKWLNNPDFKRGWIQPLYHLVAHGKTAEEKQAAIAGVTAEIENLVAHRGRIWIDTFTAVAKYGQERDSAMLRTVTSTPERIELRLVDRMRDDIFDQPLMIKVRLPDTWTAVTARQGAAAIAAQWVPHEGKPYALVRAVPDRGAVVLTR